MDNATKRSLKKQDQFVSTMEGGIGWAKENRELAIISGIVAVVLILVAVGGYSLYQHRSDEAATAFGAAMETYNAPITTPGQQIPAGVKSFASVGARAAAANAQFESIAHQYGMENDGKLAHYFAGLTYMDEGQNTSAEKALKKVAGSWNNDLASLAKLSLAQLYQQTGRDSQAADVYQQLAKGTSITVPANLAKLQLAELYTAEGKTEQARDIYAKLKDSDKDKKGNLGPAGEIAAQKLNPAAQGGQQ